MTLGGWLTGPRRRNGSPVRRADGGARGETLTARRLALLPRRGPRLHLGGRPALPGEGERLLAVRRRAGSNDHLGLRRVRPALACAAAAPRRLRDHHRGLLALLAVDRPSFVAGCRGPASVAARGRAGRGVARARRPLCGGLAAAPGRFPSFPMLYARRSSRRPTWCRWRRRACRTGIGRTTAGRPAATASRRSTRSPEPTSPGLKRAWVYHTGATPRPIDTEGGREFMFEATPIVVRDRLVLCTPHAEVIALDPARGHEIWRFDPKANTGADPFLACRGVAYDETGGGIRPLRAPHPLRDPDRAALRARSRDRRALPQVRHERRGRPHRRPRAGRSGLLISSRRPPAIVRGKAVLGGWIFDNVTRGEPSGVVRAFDTATGQLAWAYDMGRPDRTGLPPPGDQYTRQTPNVWAPISADPTLGPRLPADRQPDARFFRGRPPAVVGDIRELADRGRRRYGPDALAFPERPPRRLGFGHPRRAGPRRHPREGRRQTNAGGAACDEARRDLSVRPARRTFAHRDHGAAGPAGRGAGRCPFADTALSRFSVTAAAAPDRGAHVGGNAARPAHLSHQVQGTSLRRRVYAAVAQRIDPLSKLDRRLRMERRRRRSAPRGDVREHQLGRDR